MARDHPLQQSCPSAGLFRPGGGRGPGLQPSGGKAPRRVCQPGSGPVSRLEPSWAPVPPPASQPLGTLPLEIRNGACLIGSDCHWVPNQPPSTATRAFVKMARQLSDQGELQSLILAGDLADFPKISRHPRIMWEPQPSVADELREVR